MRVLSMSYDGVMQLAKDYPRWLLIVKACYNEAKRCNEGFAGSWVFDECRKMGGDGFPNLKRLVTYGILEKEGSSRGGRRAYYLMPDQIGVGRALEELGYL